MPREERIMRIETKNQSKPTHEQIQQRAYDLWEKAGHLQGRDEEYWLQAEAELRAEIRTQGNGPAQSRTATRQPASARTVPAEGTRSTASM